MRTIQEFFKYGLDREIPELWQPPDGIQLNLGPGDKKVIPETIGVGWQSNKLTDVVWHAPEHLPYYPDSVAAIHCYQFLEHFDGDTAVVMLKDMERVLKPGGCIYLAMPHVESSMAFQALDHKSYWNEEIWHWLFGNEYYGDHEYDWKLRVHCCFIMGVVFRNLNLFTQLVKNEE